MNCGCVLSTDGKRRIVTKGGYCEFIDHVIDKPLPSFALEQAKRDDKGYRFDILDPSFLRTLGKIADFGAKKYGDLNWQKSRMIGHADPCNHILDHLTKYKLNDPYDHKEIGSERKFHLVAIAFNAMMEFWWEEHPDASNPKKDQL